MEGVTGVGSNSSSPASAPSNQHQGPVNSGSPITTGSAGMMANMFHGLTSAGDFPPPPRMGEYSRLLMQQSRE